MTNKIQTLRVELYATRLDVFRLVLELVLTFCVGVMAVTEVQSIIRVRSLPDWGEEGEHSSAFGCGL